MPALPGPARSLSVGDLLHHLRDADTDHQAVRMILEFRLESTTTANDAPPGSQLVVRRGYEAKLDYASHGLLHARLAASGMSPRPLAELLVVRHGNRFVYSCDGARFGALTEQPHLVDPRSFEDHLCRITARDIVVDEDLEPDGTPRQVLRVDLDDEGFRRLITTFGDDPVEEMLEVLDTSGRELVMTASRGVGVHYRWTSFAEELLPGNGGAPERYVSRHSSRVTVRFEPLAAVAPMPAALDSSLPTLPSIDDVWSFARVARGGL